ncbi:hypothetical protein N7517_000772 [Penicillium concentricum]|uniref:Zn(2)-C6 fungal-type domain-containing protein n=1 Tax=Penicillium concentricum TaxID=293559 RepID=A0A9W9SQL2_9EURO|nr:uncharacterized protein N7517_000772 [Penicillium concentricum]KAJ5382861.1 hypothetical protein N7517_000772 [Penicillium concentricum]
MADQTPMVNGTDISRSPSAPLSTTYLAPSNHPLGFPCTKCKARHRRCDRTKPVCNTCESAGFATECSYPSADLPVAENRITQKTGAPFSGPMCNNASALPSTGDKRPRAIDAPERTELVNAVVGLPIQNDSSHQQTEIPQQSPAKRQKISELGSGSPARQPALAKGQVIPFDTGMPSGSRPNPPPRMRSISPTLRADETELRCNLTTEINVQRMKHRNLAAEPLRNIIKLLKKAKIERPSTDPTISRLGDTQFNDEWREEDDLMEVAYNKLEKGGRCSRALLSRFENFLYGPLMSPEEKRIQEQIICVEECLSSTSAEPTSNHNELFLHRLSKLTSHPDAYGLDKKDSRIGFLRNHLLTAISTKSKLSRANCRKFAELLDPEGDIANATLDSPGVKAEHATPKRKVPPKPTSPRVPSSYTPASPSRPTRKQNPPLPLSPSPTHPPPFPSHSSLSIPHLESVDLTDDTMIPVTSLKHKIRRISVPRSQLSQSNDTAASPATQSASKKRPASDSQSKDITAPSSKSASSNSINALAPISKGVASSSQPLASEIPKMLWDIFLHKYGHLLPVLDLDQLKVAFNMAVNHGKLAPKAIDPILGFCLAVACHLTREKSLWEGRKWNDAAVSTLRDEGNTTSLQYFYRRILQIEYVHMVGHLEKGWEILSLAISKAESLQMHTMHGGCLAVDKESLGQVRVIWQSLWTKKLFLALQLGVVNQYLDVFYISPMPMQSHIETTIGSSGGSQSFVASYFFIACASLLKHTDDLITVENNLRVTRMECPIKWFSTVDLGPFQELNESLSSWYNGLPKCLEWKGAAIEFTTRKDASIHRMSLLAHLRYFYFRLRQHRPFLILALRFSHACACEKNPHLTGKELDSVNSSVLLALVYHGAIKCLVAAQDIVQTLYASFKKYDDDNGKCEQLEYLYAASLVLIATMSVPCLMDGTKQCASPTAPMDRSMSTMAQDIRKVENLLHQYEGKCEQAPRLKQRLERSRNFLSLVRLKSVSVDTILCDCDIALPRNVWGRIYDRLGIDIPFERFVNGRLASDKITGRRMTFGWLESLPFDMDSQDV